MRVYSGVGFVYQVCAKLSALHNTCLFKNILLFIESYKVRGKSPEIDEFICWEYFLRDRDRSTLPNDVNFGSNKVNAGLPGVHFIFEPKIH